jgi:uncharacterized membrane protein YcaP (DUF421 family)
MVCSIYVAFDVATRHGIARTGETASMQFFPDNWHDIFALQTPILELVVRGSVLYFAILLLMRLMPRRVEGDLALMDVLLVVLVAKAAGNAFGGFTSVVDAIILVMVFMVCNYLVNALSYRVPFIERLLAFPPLRIIRNGELLRRNMRREFLTEEEVMSQLRQQGISNLREVKAAYVEAHGNITVIKRKKQA